MSLSKREWKKEEIQAEWSLLKILRTKEYFTQYHLALDARRLMPSTALLLEDYKKYFSLYPDDAIILQDKFYSHFTQEWHRRDLDEQDIQIYQEQVFPNIEAAEDNTSCLQFLITETYSARLKEQASKDILGCQAILDEYKTKLVVDDVDKDIVTIDTVDFSILDKSKGIPWFLPALQTGLGSLVQGQFVIIAADYGVGKSGFVISQVAHTLKHLKEKNHDGTILYFNSEGTSGDVFGRILSNVFRADAVEGFEEICQKNKKYINSFKEEFGIESLKVIQIVTGDYDKIQRKIEQYQPSLVIIDIADVLANEENVFQLKKLYDSLRLISAKYCPILATTQSGSTSYFDPEDKKVKHRKWLSERDLYGSKSGKGGAADTIVGIGKDTDYPSIRYINTPKKKRGVPVHVTCELIDKFSFYKEIMDSGE